MSSIYSLVALGFVLIFTAVSVVNFAQGEFVMIPAFVAVFLLASLRDEGTLSWGPPYSRRKSSISKSFGHNFPVTNSRFPRAS